MAEAAEIQFYSLRSLCTLRELFLYHTILRAIPNSKPLNSASPRKRPIEE